MSYGFLGVEVDSSLKEESNSKIQQLGWWLLEEDTPLREADKKLPCGEASLEVEEDRTWTEENTHWLVLCSLVANRTWTVVPSPLVWSGGGTL